MALDAGNRNRKIIAHLWRIRVTINLNQIQFRTFAELGIVLANVGWMPPSEVGFGFDRPFGLLEYMLAREIFWRITPSVTISQFFSTLEMEEARV